METDKTYDMIIIGGGIAGMTAAIYAARANFKALVIERQVCGGLVNSTYVVENFPSYVSINGMKLMEKVHEQILKLGVHVEQVAEIESLELQAEFKTVRTDEFCYQAPVVILATGCEPVRLTHLDNCEQVHYCSICDGPAYRGKKVIVVGGGNAGFDETLYLLSLGVEHVTIVELMEECMADQSTQNEVANHKNVSICLETQIKEVCIENGRLNTAILEETDTGRRTEVVTDGIFVFIGQQPNTVFFNRTIRISEQGYIKTDRNMLTNVPGVFAAGDVVEKKFRQIPTAMSDGAVAALSAGEYLRRKPGHRR